MAARRFRSEAPPRIPPDESGRGVSGETRNLSFIFWRKDLKAYPAISCFTFFRKRTPMPGDVPVVLSTFFYHVVPCACFVDFVRSQEFSPIFFACGVVLEMNTADENGRVQGV